MADDSNDEPTIPGDADAMADELGKSEKVPQATELVRLAESHYRFAVADDGRTFAVALNGPNLARTLRGTDGLRQELSRAFYDQHKRAPSSSALADALVVIEGMASRASREPLALRVARHGHEVVIDLGTADGAAIVVSKDGWRRVERSPVVFRRTELTMPLPDPVRGGTIDELRTLLNVTGESWPLLVGWLVAAVVPWIPHPMLLFTGEQGCGKSTSAELVTTVVDPSAAPVQAPPSDVPGWVMTAAGAWVVTLDNLSGIPLWLSDALCRAVTGDGFVKRTLYADQALTVVTFRRCVVLTAIDAGALRGDLAERLLTVELERIDPDRRRPDAELRAAFAEAHPRIFGAVLDLLVQVLGRLDSIELDELPRMADFARVLAAVDKATGLGSLDAYLGIGERIAEDVVSSDLVASAVRDLVAERHDWSGTASELLKVLNDREFPEGGRKPKGWPSRPNGLSGQLKRAATVLRQVGVSVDRDTDHTKQKQRILTLAEVPYTTTGTKTERAAKSSSAPSAASATPSDLRVSADDAADDADAADDERLTRPHPSSAVPMHPDQGFLDPADDADAADDESGALSIRRTICDDCQRFAILSDDGTGQCLAVDGCQHQDPAA